jgi:hypothetical protein
MKSRFFRCITRIARRQHDVSKALVRQARSTSEIEIISCTVHFSTLKMEVMCYSETSSLFRTACYYKPEDRTHHLTLLVSFLKTGFSEWLAPLSFIRKYLTCMISIVCTTVSKNNIKRLGLCMRQKWKDLNEAWTHLNILREAFVSRFERQRAALPDDERYVSYLRG